MKAQAHTVHLMYARHSLRATALACAAAAALVASGCGGDGGDTPTPTPAPTSRTLSGAVAVGAPMSDGRLRVLDADGNVVASDVTVAEDGSYPAVTLTGNGPWRLEACGHAGAEYRCLYAVAAAPGTAQVTPLTSAAVLLAGQARPEALMNGAAATLTGASLAQAQAQLRTSLGALLTANGLSADFDFTAGALAAGSRSGYDGLLDALGVNLGQDGRPFVQFTQRLGGGNLFLDADGTRIGALSADATAASLDLPGLQAMVSRFSAALAGAAACAQPATGLRSIVADTATLRMEGNAASGGDDVAAALCAMFGHGDSGHAVWGATLQSPALQDCDLSGAAPVCGISMVLRDTQGQLHDVGDGMAVTRQGGAWRLMGSRWPLELHASAEAQRTVRIDGTTPAVQFDRALSFEIEAVPGLACAKVEQPTNFGGPVTVAYYKRHPGAAQQRSLSLWTTGGMSATVSLDPATGTTRQADDAWVLLPADTAGDATIRNFFHGGRNVTISLYADEACTTPFSMGGRSSFRLPVVGVPPIWSSMETQPWAELDAAGKAALRALSLAGNGSGSISAAWTFPNGPQGMSQIFACSRRATCGQGGDGRLGEADLDVRARSATLALRNQGAAIAADSSKLLGVFGRNGDGVNLQTNYTSCPATPAGQQCLD
ncbi:hypothetical protein [Azohydromonas lata]|uniref:hypothetical protein n=1 Tax=Azohydromonas lata TaxID=45677 RepID=UPI000AAFCAED|nr:hypothetical protein [Azohydromonas lata]